MRICLIVAMARNRTIGVAGGLPWRISDDLKNFKRLTLGKPLIMGRKTFESLGKPLAERPNIVITRNRAYPDDGIFVVEDLDAALKAAGAFSRITGESEVMVIGGAEIYRQALPLAACIYMTEVHAEVEGDAFFPELDDERWREVGRIDHEAADPKNEHPFSFVILERQSP
jgi:dihydrofolate reductase